MAGEGGLKLSKACNFITHELNPVANFEWIKGAATQLTILNEKNFTIQTIVMWKKQNVIKL